MSKIKNLESIVPSLIIIKDTRNDIYNYNYDYIQPCKLQYIFEHIIYKCPFCLKNYPDKFLFNQDP